MSLLLCVAALLLQAQETATVEGRVVNAVTGVPVRKAFVKLEPSDSARDAPFATATSANGRFEFADVPPGKYGLSVERAGYDEYRYGMKRDNLHYSLLDVPPGDRVNNLELRIMPVSAISGRVFDSDGDPAPNATVSLLQWSYSRGARLPRPTGASVSTNEDGEYRIAVARWLGLTPTGRYLLSAAHSPSILLTARRPSSSPPGPETREGPTFYPSSPDAASAVPIEIRPGAQLRGMDVRLQKVGVFRVRGRLILPAGAGRFGPVVRLIQQDATSAIDFFGGQVTDADGSFEIGGVPPGRHMVSASITAGDRTYHAWQPVDVGGRDVEDVRVTFQPGIDVKGHVRFPDSPDAPKLDGMRISLNRVPGYHGASAQVRSDRTFTIANAEPGSYRLSSWSAPDGYYLKSAMIGMEDVLGEEFELSSAAGGIELVFGRTTAGVTAVVGPKSGWVMLLPDPWVEGPYFTQSIADSGSAEFKSVAPGRYAAFAVAQIDNRYLGDPEYMEKIKDKVVKLTIDEDTRVTVNLKFIDWEELPDLP